MKLVVTTMISAAAMALTAPALAAPSSHTRATPDPGTTDATAPATQADTATTTTTTTHTAATAKAGDTVYDNTGVAAGTVESVNGTTFVLATSAGKATVPLRGLSNGPKGLTIAMTKTQLEEAIRKAKG